MGLEREEVRRRGGGVGRRGRGLEGEGGGWKGLEKEGGNWKERKEVGRGEVICMA